MADNTTVLGNMAEQPERLKYVFENREKFVRPFVDVLSNNPIKKIIFFGSGTSFNVSVIGSYYFKHIAGIGAEAQYPTVFMNYEKADWNDILKKEEVLFVGISQSGTSVSTCELMEYAKSNGYPTLAITGNLQSEITKHVDTVCPLLVGDELTPPETKGYTVSLLSVYLWALEAAKAKGKLSDSDYETKIKECESFIANFDTVMKESEDWYDTNKTTIVNSDRIYILGYGVDYGSALEAQLKIGEMLRVPSISYEIVEYSHGPTMALNKKQSIFMIGSDEVEFKQMLKFNKAFKNYSDRVHIITCKDLAESDGRDLVFSVKADKYLAPIMYTVPFQFVAAKGAKDIGIDTAINPFEIPLAHYQE